MTPCDLNSEMLHVHLRAQDMVESSTDVERNPKVAKRIRTCCVHSLTDLDLNCWFCCRPAVYSPAHSLGRSKLSVLQSGWENQCST